MESYISNIENNGTRDKKKTMRLMWNEEDGK